MGILNLFISSLYFAIKTTLFWIVLRIELGFEKKMKFIIER